jgi:hypothetical protein
MTMMHPSPSPAQPPGEQLDLLRDLTPTPLPDQTAAILDCVSGDPIHARDRARVIAAIVADAEEHDDEIDADRVRARLVTDDGQLIVYPRLLSALYGHLARAGVIQFDHWKTSEDAHGGNQGRPARVWRLVREAA